ncbi:MAG: hypothetical protein ACJ716_01760 [Marmoricola sp.]
MSCPYPIRASPHRGSSPAENSRKLLVPLAALAAVAVGSGATFTGTSGNTLREIGIEDAPDTRVDVLVHAAGVNPTGPTITAAADGRTGER